MTSRDGGVSAAAQDERNALHEACRSQSDDEAGLAQIVELLVECGCDLNSKSSDVGEVSAATRSAVSAVTSI